MTAEHMLRRVGVEGVGRNVRLVREKAKILLAHEQVQETRHVTNTAIAFCCIYFCRRIHLKSYLAAMASPVVCDHVVFLLSFCQISSRLFAGIA